MEVFASNNNIALSCLKYFNEKNIRVPQDIALMSFDDINLFEDDFLFGNSSASSNKHKDAQNTETVKSEALSLNSEENISNWNSRNLSTFIIPLAIEVVAIYYGIMYFN